MAVGFRDLESGGEGQASVEVLAGEQMVWHEGVHGGAAEVAFIY